jgi:hypothetical protein
MSEPSIEITEQRLELADLPGGLRDIYAYWQDKRGSARMPARADVDPLDFGRMLGSVTLMEVNPGAAALRVSRLGNAHGAPPRWRP